MDNRDDLSSSSHEGTFSDSTHRESSNCECGGREGGKRRNGGVVCGI